MFRSSMFHLLCGHSVLSRGGRVLCVMYGRPARTKIHDLTTSGLFIKPTQSSCSRADSVSTRLDTEDFTKYLEKQRELFVHVVVTRSYDQQGAYWNSSSWWCAKITTTFQHVRYFIIFHHSTSNMLNIRNPTRLTGLTHCPEVSVLRSFVQYGRVNNISTY